MDQAPTTSPRGRIYRISARTNISYGYRSVPGIDHSPEATGRQIIINMLLLTFSGTAVLLGLGGLCLVVGLTVFALRGILKARSAAPTGKRVKHAAFSFTTPLHRLSLCVAIAASLIAINYTDTAPGQVLEGYTVEDIVDLDVVPPITNHPPPPPPPPPPPLVIEPVVEPEIEQEISEDQSISFEDDVPTSLALNFPIAPAAPPPPPPPPPPKPEGPGEIVLIAEQMPVFGRARFDLSGNERKLCSDRALLTFVQSRVNYPSIARENGIEGTVVISFTVEKDGSISDVTVAREVGGGCTASALRAVKAINGENERFQPGRQNGSPVRVRYNLPVKFRLD